MSISLSALLKGIETKIQEGHLDPNESALEVLENNIILPWGGDYSYFDESGNETYRAGVQRLLFKQEWEDGIDQNNKVAACILGSYKKKKELFSVYIEHEPLIDYEKCKARLKFNSENKLAPATNSKDDLILFDTIEEAMKKADEILLQNKKNILL